MVEFADIEATRNGLGSAGPLAQSVLSGNSMTAFQSLSSEAVKCLSTARPSRPVVGQMIFETDTNLAYWWNGTAWVSGSSTPGASVLTPVGAIVPYGGSESSTPAGWLFCGGQAVSRSTYSALFAVVGTTYGSGDGSTTFNVPDLRGRVLAGKDNMGGTAANRLTSGGSGVAGTTLGSAGGSETHTLTTAQMPSHNHSINDPSHRHQEEGNQPVGASGGGGVGEVGVNYNKLTGYSTTGITINNTGGGGAHQNTQPTIVTNYIIKAIADTVTGSIGSVLTGAAGGDLSGSYPNPTVTNITNAPVHNSNTTLSFRTSGTERMSIDASGRVRMPYQPAFLVTRISMSNAASVLLTYNTTQVNIGSHMNLGTGLFTAPVAGTYLFSFTAFSETSVGSGAAAYPYVNGSALATYRSYTSNSGYAGLPGLVIPWTLAANDTFGIYIAAGAIHGNANGHFAGHLIG